MSRKFLVVVDTQYDFMMPKGALYVNGAESIIIPGIEFLSKISYPEYCGVLFTADTHWSDTYYDLPESKEFPIHCVRGSAGWENVFNPSLIPSEVDKYFLEKGVFSMWEEETLEVFQPATCGADFNEEYDRDQFFKDLLEEDDPIIQVMGVASDYCVKWAVDGFIKRGFKVEVIQDLCRGIAAPASEVFGNQSEYKDVVLG